MEIAKRPNLLVIEDAAQGVMASYKGRTLGSIGHLGAYSFHETKNVISGEGGALLVNDPSLVDRAEIIREKGTNRSRFFRGQVDKYTWVDVGSSYLPGEIIAAFLWAQLEEAGQITANRLSLWSHYHEAFGPLEAVGRVRRPFIPPSCQHGGHLYYLLLKDAEDRDSFIERMREGGINCVFHYVPLHSSPAGRRYSRAVGDMVITKSVADRLVRLPMWMGLEPRQHEVIEAAIEVLS